MKERQDQKDFLISMARREFDSKLSPRKELGLSERRRFKFKGHRSRHVVTSESSHVRHFFYIQFQMSLLIWIMTFFDTFSLTSAVSDVISRLTHFGTTFNIWSFRRVHASLKEAILVHPSVLSMMVSPRLCCFHKNFKKPRKLKICSEIELIGSGEL